MAKEKKSSEKEEGKKNKKKLIVTIVLLVVFIPALVTQVLWFLGPGRITQKNAIKDYYKAVGKEDVELLKDVSYPKKWQKHYKPNGQEMDLDSVIESSFMYQSGASFSKLKIVSDEDLSGETAKAFQRGIEDIYGVELDVSAVSRVTFRMHVELPSGESQDTGDMVRYLYKVSGKWYFLSDTLLQVHLDLD